VFDRFWRADPSRKRTIGGTGLGLAISMEDASLHRGQLDVWSEPGQGTCFRLTLPRNLDRSILVSPLDLPPSDPVDELEVNSDGILSMD
jgi:two-component system sensor histidine kinase MtrB